MLDKFETYLFAFSSPASSPLRPAHGYLCGFVISIGHCQDAEDIGFPLGRHALDLDAYDAQSPSGYSPKLMPKSVSRLLSSLHVVGSSIRLGI